MHDPSFITRRGIVAALSMAAIVLPNTSMATRTTTQQDEVNEHSNEISILPPPGDAVSAGSLAGSAETGLANGSMLAVPAFAPTFTTVEDARAFWDMAVRVYSSPMPNPRNVASAFIREQLGIDGDAYVVAHFATPMMRSEGIADNAVTLTAALMNAFPEHSTYTFFGRLAGIVGGIASGGRQSPGAFAFVESVATCKNATECFARIGRFLWSRTGPGYIYNTFIGEGNVLDTASEELRSLDDAFGIFPRTSTFLPENVSPFQLSAVVGKFREEGVFSELPYIKRLKSEFDRYWAAGKAEWPLLARYRFIELARTARARGVLTQDQYELVMKGGAPDAPLDGSITLRQLRNTPPAAPVRVKRFDINGYAASDIVRFVAVDGSEVMYVPGARVPFAVFRNEGELREWVVRQARDRGTLNDLLSHFSIYNSQDGVFWTGVAQGLIRLADLRWMPDDRAINVSHELIQGDVFEDIRAQTEARLRDDARMQTRTAWDAWRTTLNRTATVLGPLGYGPQLAIPILTGSALIGAGTGIDEGINGRSAGERKRALEQAVMTVVTNASLAVLSGNGGALAGEGDKASLAVRPPQRVNGRIGYVLGPMRPPRSESAMPMEREQQAAAGGESALEPSTEEGSSGRRIFDPMAQSDPGQASGAVGAQERGYVMLSVPVGTAARAERVVELKKTMIDETRQRLDDFRTESLATSSTGSRISVDKSIVYRVDDRTPQQLLASNGFGPSMQFYDIPPMLRQPITIGSGSLQASNGVLRNWEENFPFDVKFHQYAIWTDGRAVATAADNHSADSHDVNLDEVHFPADVPARDIYIIDSLKPSYAKAIAEIYESAYVSTPYGVPLEAFVEYLAGRLDINAPNRFTPQRASDLPSQGASASESGSILSISHRPLSPTDVSHSDESVPLLPPVP